MHDGCNELKRVSARTDFLIDGVDQSMGFGRLVGSNMHQCVTKICGEIRDYLTDPVRCGGDRRLLQNPGSKRRHNLMQLARSSDEAMVRDGTCQRRRRLDSVEPEHFLRSRGIAA